MSLFLNYIIFYVVYLGDTMIAAFLIGCNNSIEKTKQCLDKYYTLRSQMPYYYSDRDPLKKRIQLCSEAL